MCHCVVHATVELTHWPANLDMADQYGLTEQPSGKIGRGIYVIASRHLRPTIAPDLIYIQRLRACDGSTYEFAAVELPRNKTCSLVVPKRWAKLTPSEAIATLAMRLCGVGRPQALWDPPLTVFGLRPYVQRTPDPSPDTSTISDEEYNRLQLEDTRRRSEGVHAAELEVKLEVIAYDRVSTFEAEDGGEEQEKVEDATKEEEKEVEVEKIVSASA